jgi:hypothetical protein
MLIDNLRRYARLRHDQPGRETRQRRGVGRSTHARDCEIHRPHVSNSIPRSVWRVDCGHQNRSTPDPCDQCGYARERPVVSRRIACREAGFKKTQAHLSRRFHDVLHLRTLSHVHEQRALGEARSCCLWRDHCRRKLSLSADSYSCERGCGALRHEVRGGRTGASRTLRFPVQVSQNAESVSNLEFAQASAQARLAETRKVEEWTSWT